MTDLLSAIGTIEIPRPKPAVGSDFLCAQPQFAFAREQICGSPDVATSKSLDFDPGARCDALSVGLAFSAFAAVPGDLHASSATANPCVRGSDGQPVDAGQGAGLYRCPK